MDYAREFFHKSHRRGSKPNTNSVTVNNKDEFHDAVDDPDLLKDLQIPGDQTDELKNELTKMSAKISKLSKQKALLRTKIVCDEPLE